MDTSPASPSEKSETSIHVSRSEVTVFVRQQLGFDTWRKIRDARDIARDRHLALRIDMQECSGSTMGGIATLHIAKERLGSVSLCNCPDRIAYFFDGLGICGMCGNNQDAKCVSKRASLRGKSTSEVCG
jgi:hypothetical protein